MPWVDRGSDGGRARETLRFARERGIDTLLIDNTTWSVQQVVAGIA
jgi:hypothetical protein